MKHRLGHGWTGESLTTCTITNMFTYIIVETNEKLNWADLSQKDLCSAARWLMFPQQTTNTWLAPYIKTRSKRRFRDCFPQRWWWEGRRGGGVTAIQTQLNHQTVERRPKVRRRHLSKAHILGRATLSLSPQVSARKKCSLHANWMRQFRSAFHSLFEQQNCSSFLTKIIPELPTD